MKGQEEMREVQGDTSPRVLGSVAINLGSSPACGPLLQLPNAQAGGGEVPKVIAT